MRTNFYYNLRVSYGGRSFHAPSDTHAQRLAAKWIALFWPAYVRNLRERHSGSMAHADADAWYAPPTWALYRRTIDESGVIACEGTGVYVVKDVELPRVPETLPPCTAGRITPRDVRRGRATWGGAYGNPQPLAVST